MRLSIIADDLTGGADIGGRLAREGTPARLFVGIPECSTAPGDHAVVIALNTRNIDPARAVADSTAACDWLTTAGADRIYLKISSSFDSTDRGNIGPVLDALAERLRTDRVLVCPTAPEYGRTVRDGVLAVWGTPLAESPMRHHPLTPMRESRVDVLLGRQSTRAVARIPLEVVATGGTGVARAIATAPPGHLVADAVDDADLDALAAGAADLPLSAGSTGLGAAIARTSAPRALAATRAAAAGRTAILSGSCSPATLRQVAAHLDRFPGFRLDPIELDVDLDAVVRRALEYARGHPAPLVFGSAPPDEVAAAHARLGVERSASLLGAAFARIAARLVAEGLDRMIVAGGETAGSVLPALGLREFDVGAEVAPGVPWLHSTGPTPMDVLLKAGNFGDPELFVRESTA